VKNKGVQLYSRKESNTKANGFMKTYNKGTTEFQNINKIYNGINFNILHYLVIDDISQG
jgi:hypothetical protein